MSAVCFMRRDWESADGARLITVKTGRWVHGFVVLFSLLLFIFEISVMRTFFQSRSQLIFFHLCNSFLLHFGNWLIYVATWNLAHTLFSIPYKNPLISRADLHYLKVVWLLLVPGNAKKWWMLALQALGSPTMRKTPKMPPKPLRIACKKSRGTFQSVSRIHLRLPGGHSWDAITEVRARMAQRSPLDQHSQECVEPFQEYNCISGK